MAVFLVLTIVLGLVLVGIVAVLVSPLVELVRERQRVEQEVRLAEWRMRQVAHRAMQHLMDEARRSHGGPR